MRKTITISVPTDEIKKVEKIQQFCKDHKLNFSGIAVQKLIDWYDVNHKTVQKMFYNPSISN